MKKDLILFLLKLALSVTVLGLIWFYYFQMLYPEILKPIFLPLFQSLGVRKWRLYQLLDHFTNLVPYIALIIATPGFFKNWKKTVISLVGGLAILIVGHFVLSYLDDYYYARYQQTKQFFRSTFHYYVINDALPFLLWLAFYPKILTQLFGFKRLAKEIPPEDTSD